MEFGNRSQQCSETIKLGGRFNALIWRNYGKNNVKIMNAFSAPRLTKSSVVLHCLQFSYKHDAQQQLSA